MKRISLVALENHMVVLQTRNEQLLEDIKKAHSAIERYEKAIYDSEVCNAELIEVIKKAHEILLHEMDNGRTPTMLQGVGLGYFENIICESKRGVKNAYRQGYSSYDMGHENPYVDVNSLKAVAWHRGFSEAKYGKPYIRGTTFTKVGDVVRNDTYYPWG